MISNDARKIAGLYISDVKRHGVLGWIQTELRTGSLSDSIRKFVESQPEPMDAQAIVPEWVDENRIIARMPFKMADHESRTPFRVDLYIKIDPETGICEKLPF